MSIRKTHAYKYGELKVAAENVARAILNFKDDMILSDFELEFLQSRAQSVLDLIEEQEERGAA